MRSGPLALTLSSPICRFGVQLFAHVIVVNKIVEQPVPFQEVQEASSEQCHGGCLKLKWLWWEGWGFPLEREQQWHSVAAESVSVRPCNCWHAHPLRSLGTRSHLWEHVQTVGGPLPPCC